MSARHSTRPLVHAPREDQLVKVPLTDIDDTFIGTQVLIAGRPMTDGSRGVICGGISDLEFGDDRDLGRWVAFWIAGRCVVVVGPQAYVIAAAPPQETP